MIIRGLVLAVKDTTAPKPGNITSLEPTEIAILAIGIPLTYLLFVALGRWLKRKRGVPFGICYQLFALAFAIYLPLNFLEIKLSFGSFEVHRDVGVAAFLFGAISISSLLRRYVWELYFQERRHVPVPKFLQQLSTVFIIAASIFLILRVGYHFELTAVLAGSGIAAIVLGLAMQDLLGSVLAGIALEMGRPFKPGDWLIIDNTHAEVIEVNWRSTRLRTNDDVYLDIPNAQIVKSTVVNLSYPTKTHAMRLILGVDYASAPNIVKQVLEHATSNAKGVLEFPKPKIYLKDFGDSAIIYEIKYWIENHKQHNDIQDAIRTNIWYEFKRKNISIPFPIRTVQLQRVKPAKKAIPPRVGALIRENALFQCLEEEQLNTLIETATLMHYGKDEKIIEQDTEGDSMFFLIRGKAQIFLKTSGGQKLINSLKPGDYFGEMSLLTGEKRSTTVIAETDCEALEIRKAIFGEVVGLNTALFQRLSDALANRRTELDGIKASDISSPEKTPQEKEYKQGLFKKISSFFEI